MTRNDIIFAIICGLSVAWIGSDFFKQFEMLFIFVLPILSILGLWIVELIGKKFLFAYQAGKFILAGSFADVVDIKVFQLIFLLIPATMPLKIISFIVATMVKYVCDKYWTFKQNGKSNMEKEIAVFFVVATVGAVLNVASFYYLVKINIGITPHLWIELSIILAAVGAGLWNFLGYKFLVFKK